MTHSTSKTDSYDSTIRPISPFYDIEEIQRATDPTQTNAQFNERYDDRYIDELPNPNLLPLQSPPTSIDNEVQSLDKIFDSLSKESYLDTNLIDSVIDSNLEISFENPNLEKLDDKAKDVVVSIYYLLAAFTKKIAPLISKIEMLENHIAEARIVDIQKLFENKIWIIQMQGWANLGFTVGGGACSLVSAGAPGIAANFPQMKEIIEGVGKGLEAAGKVLPQGGMIVNTFQKGEETRYDGKLSEMNQHRLPETDRMRKYLNDTQDRLEKTFAQIVQEHASAYKLK